MSEIRADDPSSWGRHHLCIWSNGWKVCRCCMKFGIEEMMVKVESPADGTYYLCTGCERKLKRIFASHGKSFFTFGA